MKIAVWSLTRDRLQFTKDCFQSLWDKAGYSFDHYVLDNGSSDDTYNWLLSTKRKYYWVYCNRYNTGIPKSGNMVLDRVFRPLSGTLGQTVYDLIIKMDNDCFIKTPGILKKIVEFYEHSPYKDVVVSPRVDGINHQPSRHNIVKDTNGKWAIGFTNIVGGLFRVVPRAIQKQYRFDEASPRASCDGHFAKWCQQQKIPMGYLEHLVVEHYKGTDAQAKIYPEYHKRKIQEIKEDGGIK